MITLVLGLGCGPVTLHDQGLAELRLDNYDAAIELLKQEVKVRPDNWEAHRDLGIAYYEDRQYEPAVLTLREVLEHEPNDGAALFFLGATHEKSNDNLQAIEVYKRYIDLGSLPLIGDRFRDQMEGRIASLLHKQATREVDQLLELERRHALPAPDQNTLAVLPLTPQSSEGNAPYLAAALADWITTDLSKIRSRRMVERLQLDALLRELKRTQGGEFDPASSPRAGRLLGAREVVYGSLAELGDDRLRIDLKVSDVETAEIGAAEDIEGPLDEFFQLEKRLVFDLLTSMGITPTPLERREIEHIPTRNLRAFLAYGEGLLAEYHGELDDARLAYQDALDHDASFSIAAEARDQVSTPEEADLNIMIANFLDSRPSPEENLESGIPGSGNRLVETDGLTGGDFWPEDPSETRPWDQTKEIPDPPALPELQTPIR